MQTDSISACPDSNQQRLIASTHKLCGRRVHAENTVQGRSARSTLAAVQSSSWLGLLFQPTFCQLHWSIPTDCHQQRGRHHNRSKMFQAASHTLHGYRLPTNIVIANIIPTVSPSTTLLGVCCLWHPNSMPLICRSCPGNCHAEYILISAKTSFPSRSFVNHPQALCLRVTAAARAFRPTPATGNPHRVFFVTGRPC